MTQNGCCALPGLLRRRYASMVLRSSGTSGYYYAIFIPAIFAGTTTTLILLDRVY
jgi:hypothetical protein